MQLASRLHGSIPARFSFMLHELGIRAGAVDVGGDVGRCFSFSMKSQLFQIGIVRRPGVQFCVGILQQSVAFDQKLLWLVQGSADEKFETRRNGEHGGVVGSFHAACSLNHENAKRHEKIFVACCAFCGRFVMLRWLRLLYSVFSVSL